MRAVVFMLMAVFLFANDLNQTKTILKQTKSSISEINQKLSVLAKKIRKKERSIRYLNRRIKYLNYKIKLLQKKVENSAKDLNSLNDLKNGYLQKLKAINNEVYDFLSENYYIQTQNVENINDLIYNEITKEVLSQYSTKLKKVLKEAKEINEKLKEIEGKIIAVKRKQQLLEKTKQKLATLLSQRKKEIKSLSEEKKAYKERLSQMLKRQKLLEQKLKELKILSQKETNFSTNEEAPVYEYKGLKFTPPIDGVVVGKFGKVVDKVSHVTFNRPFVIIKADKPNAVVRNVLDGKVLNILKERNLIAIKHKNGLITIYKVDKISPLLKIGAFVKRGQVIARVKEYLQFGVFKNGRPINPQKLFPLK